MHKINIIKKGFTLLEILFVIFIVGLLVGILRQAFVSRNQDFFYSQVCTNTLYGKIQNFLNNAITGKGIYRNTGFIYPDTYTIIFDPEQNELRFEYTIDDLTGTDQMFGLSGTNRVPTQYYCQTNAYNIFLTGEFLKVSINRGLQVDRNFRTFSLQKQDESYLFTGSIPMQLCYTNTTACQELTEFIIDTRIQSIKNKSCLQFSKTGDTLRPCIERNQ